MPPFFIKLRSGSLINMNLITEIAPTGDGGSVLSTSDGATITVPDSIEDFEDCLLDDYLEDEYE